MRQTRFLMALGVLICMTSSVPALADDRPVDLTIVYSNNIMGYVKPCPT
jgi:hypothetical protein